MKGHSPWVFAIVFLMGLRPVAAQDQDKGSKDPTAPIPRKPASSASITSEQAEEILEELRQIRQLLERQQGQGQQGQTRQPAAAPLQRAKVWVAANSHVLGRDDAPLTLVEFIDYQCAFCQRHSNTTFVEIKRKYVDTGVLRYVSRDLPLEFHGNAFRAARAARCAAEQDKYWELRQAIFANVNKLEPADLTADARSVQADVPAFEKCLAGERLDAAIRSDAAEAARLSITGTPTFVLGRTSKDAMDGLVLVGAQPLSAFESHIQELLAGR
jgi:protein-disulfide isomerase